MSRTKQMIAFAVAALMLPLWVAPAVDANSSSVEATMPEGRAGMGALWDGTHAYVFGGTGAASPILRYDPASGVVIERSTVLDAFHRDGAAVAWGGYRAILFGGSGSNSSSPFTIGAYDPAYDFYSTVGSLPVDLEGAQAIWTGSRILIFGGYSQNLSVGLNTIYEFNVDDSSLTTKTAVLPTPLWQHSVVWDGQYAWILGGKSPAVNTQVFRYDPVGDEIVTMSVTMPHLESAGAVWDGKRVLIPASSRSSGAVLAYDTVNDALDGGLPSLTNPVCCAPAVFTGSEVLVFGGDTASTGTLADIVHVTLTAGPPTPFDISAPEQGALSLTWGAPDYDTYWGPVTGYRVYRAIGASEPGLLATLSPYSFSYYDSGLPDKANVVYHVAANTMAGEGDVAIKSAFTWGVPDAPYLFDNSSVWGQVAILYEPAWSEPAITSVVVQAPDGVYEINTTGDLFVEDGLPRVTRHYNVTVTNALGSAVASISITPKTQPGAPPVTATAGPAAGNIKLEWSPAASNGNSIYGYRITRLNDGANFVVEGISSVYSWTDTGLAAGTLYEYEVRALAFEGIGALALVTATTFDTPTIHLQSTVGEWGVVEHVVTVDPVEPPVTSILLQTPTGSISLDVENPTWRETGLARVERTYSAVATNALGDGYSHVVAVTPTAQPDAPTLSVTPDSRRGYMRLEWTDGDLKGNEPDNYVIERLDDGLTFHTWVPGIGTHLFYDANLELDTTYNYTVRYRGIYGDGFEAAGSSTTHDVPDKPHVVARAGPAAGEVTLSWTLGDDGGLPIHTVVVTKVVNGQTSVDEYTVDGVNSRTYKSLPPGATVTFTVTAHSAIGGSPASVSNATTFRPPGAITDARSSVNARTVDLMWTPPPALDTPISGYTLTRTQGDTTVVLPTLVGSANHYRQSNVPAGEWVYHLTAHNLVGAGTTVDISATVLVAVLPNLPAVPPSSKSCEQTAIGPSCSQGSLEPVISLVAGARHTCVRLADNRVDCYGDNARGQSADFAGPGIASVSAGATHTCVARALTAVCAGDGAWGKTAVSGATNVTMVAAGGTHTCMLHYGATVSCVGFNNAGQAPARIDDKPIRSVATGDRHTCVTYQDGDVSCFGSNSHGQRMTYTGGHAAATVAGERHTCILTAERTVLCAGAIAPPPAAVQGAAISLASGASHMCAVLADKTVTCWGDDRYGQSAGDAAGDVIAVAAGESHTCFLRVDRTVDCIGGGGLFADLGQTSRYPGGSS